MEWTILIIALLIVFGYLLFKTKQSPKFELRNETVFFFRDKRTIPYSNILSIERDMPGSFSAWLTNISYVITYYDEPGKTDSFRFTKSSIDDVKWETLKRIILKVNPAIKIDESIF